MKRKDNNVKYKDDALKTENNALKKELAELKQQILYKEDFIIGENHSGSIETYDGDNTFYIDDIKHVLKDNSKYDKLPSKEEK
ncbi:hypothetical protein [Spiroplasma citri]|uniref:hypothetical protein n=1 Tax=Spiroplasma citri TaxID=2133 RepID=UPI0011BB781E|nr:hypothetical protein [Spiroplasma citri]QED24637.1 hypothetical protein FRX96_04140 [Spiroplasma citri]